MLSEITNENPNQYVFVGTHGPVAESKIYGTIKELEPGADWGTSRNNINKVLSKYPQTVIFSGHTHMSAELETTIMQTNYTAINVPPVLTRCYYNTGEQDFIDGKYASYLDGTYPDNQHGMGMYIEIDECGNMRIRRINFTRNRAKLSVKNVGEKENPAVGTWPGEPERFIYVELDSCAITANEKASFIKTDWVLDAPDKGKKFLDAYSMNRGKDKAPEFPQNSFAFAKRCDLGNIKVQFPAAISERYVLYYKIIIKSENKADKEFRVLGNWVDIKKGVILGNNHKDAKTFEYELPPIISDNDSCVLKISAVDEYGNESKPLEKTL